MEKLQFKKEIQAPSNKVFDLMLGISNKATYEQWAGEFNPTSTYDGNWSKGSKILFLGSDEFGKQGGMVSEVAENRLNHFVSIRHYGLLIDGVEVTEGSDVEKWANGFENYFFEENNGVTMVTVDLDTAPDFVDFMNETFPKALDRLKEMCEQ
jgi:hypothetical protein